MSESTQAGTWQVSYSSAALKQKKKLPGPIVAQLASLTWDLEHHGPFLPVWLHYGPLKRNRNIPENSHHPILKAADQLMWFAGK